MFYSSRLTHEQYNVLAAKIVGLFPSEYSGTYYVPAIRKAISKSGRPILAKGKLVDKCKNLLHNCADVIPSKRKRRGDSDDVNPEVNLKRNALNPTEIDRE